MLEKKEIHVLHDSGTFSSMKKAETNPHLNSQDYHLLNFLHYHLHQNDVFTFEILKDLFSKPHLQTVFQIKANYFD